jgi:UDP-N-acetylmuramoylalanine--D-glutamate ligase
MLDLRNKRVTVQGLGRFGGGIAVARWLAGQGARVLVTDKDPAEKLADSVKQLAGVPIEFRLGEHREDDFRNTDVVVASPAVPLNNQYLAAARSAGVPITTEIRLFVERLRAGRVVGVTGTKGKSTTTSMLAAMLGRKHKTWVGGNIGKSLLEDLPNIAEGDVVVLELSSFMLEHLRPMRWSPHVAVVTMVAQDHLDWHGSLEAYVDAKRVLLAFQKPTDFAVLNETDPGCRAIARSATAQVRFYGKDVARPFNLKLPGIHNQVNAQGAFTAASCLGVTWEDAQAALDGYKSLPHRLELVHEERGVRFYNDSIATIPEAALAALHSFPAGRVIQIIGGRQKDLPLDAMCQELARRAKGVLCIGEKGPDLAEKVTKAGGRIVHLCHDLTGAIGKAKEIAREGDIVLLSTGCKSYDQFINFEQRGETFARLARGH